MNSLETNTRDTKSKGDVRSLRLNGEVPAIVYGGSEQNEKVSVSKKVLKSLLDKEGFLSSVITLNINGKKEFFVRHAASSRAYDISEAYEYINKHWN